MFPQVSDLINSVFGTSLKINVPTYGTLLTLAMITAYTVVALELRRMAREGCYPHGIIHLVFALFNVGLFFGFIGGKLLHILDHWKYFIQDPLHQLFSLNGHSYYGFLIGGTAATIVFLRIKKLPLRHSFDIAAPALFIGMAIGRMGCYLSGDGCWGIINNSPLPGWLSFLPEWTWRSWYPHNVINAGTPIQGYQGEYAYILEQPVFPTSLYESVLYFILFGLIWFLRKRKSVPGMLGCFFLILNGLSRFSIEFIRVNPKMRIVGTDVSQAQLIALLLILTGIIAIPLFIRYDRRMQQDVKIL